MKINDGNNGFGAESSNIIEAIAQEAEQIVTKACEAARQEAEQELEKVLREYEQKTKQIVLKIKEEAKSMTAEITGRLGEAIMMRIEESSAEAVAGAISNFGKKAEQVFAGTENIIQSNNNGNGNGSTVRKDTIENKNISANDSKEKIEEVYKAKPSFEIEIEQELSGISGNGTNGGTKKDSEEFENWLTQ